MASKSGFKLSWVIAGGVIALSIGAFNFLSAPGNLVYFYTPDEAFAQVSNLSGKTLRIGGMVKPGTLLREDDGRKIHFVLWDLKSSEFTVDYLGTPPDMFKENQGVVVEGRIDQTAPPHVVAQKLLVKHSEEYKKPGQGHSLDKELLKQSILKD